MLWPNKRRTKTILPYSSGKLTACENVKNKRTTMADAKGSRNGFGSAKHFKKKILQQHVRPPEAEGNANGVDIRRDQPTQRKQLNEATQKNVSVEEKQGDAFKTVKQATAKSNSASYNGNTNGTRSIRKKNSRLQFRHKDIEIYKLGSAGE